MSMVDCYLWNRLGRTGEVTRSEIGVNGVENNTPVYGDGKYAGALILDDNASKNYVSFNTTHGMENWSVECWITRTGNFHTYYWYCNDPLAIVASNYLFRWYTTDPYGLGVDLSNSAGLFSLMAYNFGSLASFHAAFPLNTPVHSLITFDNGAAGGIDDMLDWYIDGVHYDVTLRPAGTDRSPFTGTTASKVLCNMQTASDPEIIIDNLKVYDTTTTRPVSQRFIEGFGGARPGRRS